MPTYEYSCSKCGHRFEKVQSITERSLTVCPKELCARKNWGKGKVKRMIVTGAGLIFKGSGFYATDYRSENYKEGAKKEAPPPASTSKESKPAPAKTESKPSSSPAESKPAKPKSAASEH